MIKYLRPLIITLLVFTANLVLAQNNSAAVDQILTSLQKQSAAFPVEKVYLHLDKPFYGAGDTIWFKAYAVTGEGHQLSALSNVLNVELIDERNRLIRSIKLPMIGGVTFGDFAPGDTITEGNYRIRAYTNWMRNAGPEYFFDRTIAIVNNISNKVFTNTTFLVAGQQVNARVNYTGADGNPYVGKEVKYEVLLGTGRLTKGKGVTDEKGNLNLSFTDAGDGAFSRGELITSIQTANQSIIKTIPIKLPGTKVDMQFFPESGVMVNGIASKVAFKAVGGDGLGADVKGLIVDDLGNEIAPFNSTHLGMGIFKITPVIGRSYKANITYPDGKTGQMDLPKAQDKGYVMTIDGRTDSLNLIVKIAGDLTSNGLVTLVAQAGGEVFLQGKGKPGKSSFTAMIAKNKLPSGIVQFTLFADTGEPLNERLVFIQNPDQLKLTLTTEKKSYPARQKVRINLNSRDKDDQPAQGNFSVSVIDETKVPVDENTENTIISNLLLTSDIKGYIEQPNYYFAHPDVKTVADLDVLMLTQGYHRFEWKKIIDHTDPVTTYQPEKTIAIAGYFKNTDGKALANSKVTLVNNSGSFFALDTVTDKNGRFVFNVDFKDSTRFTVKTIAAKTDYGVIELDNKIPDLQNNKNRPDVQVNLHNDRQAYLQNNKNRYEQEVKSGIGDHSIVLNQVNIKTSKPKTEKQLKIEQAVEYSANLNGPGNADQIVTYEEFEGKGCATIGDCLAGKLLGVTFSPTGTTAYSTRGNNSFRGKAPMMVILDGVQTQSAYLNINLDDIESIEVLRSIQFTAIYGSRGANGVLVITTKHGSDVVVGDNKKDIIHPQGYYVSRSFYSPQYNNPKTNIPLADLRTTIFWKPILQTDKSGNTYFEFFNAGNKGTYRVVAEGIDYKTGGLGRVVYTYKVE